MPTKTSTKNKHRHQDPDGFVLHREENEQSNEEDAAEKGRRHVRMVEEFSPKGSLAVAAIAGVIPTFKDQTRSVVRPPHPHYDDNSNNELDAFPASEGVAIVEAVPQEGEPSLNQHRSVSESMRDDNDSGSRCNVNYRKHLIWAAVAVIAIVAAVVAVSVNLPKNSSGGPDDSAADSINDNVPLRAPALPPVTGAPTPVKGPSTVAQTPQPAMPPSPITLAPVKGPSTVAPTPQPALAPGFQANVSSIANFTVGRPFRDGDGMLVSSSAVMGDEQMKLSHPWSLPTENTKRQPKSSFNTSKHIGNSLALEWTTRALGEHASIASFAAFTIALLTNEAPPELVRDALNAALDELRHAETSFEMASLLQGGEAVEPSALPFLMLRFDSNKATLALGAAREGCVEETLSALIMAAEVDDSELMGQQQNRNINVSHLLAVTTKTIVMEEASHSALAWRTVLWVCSVDPDACHAVQRDVLNPKALSDVAEDGRLAGSWRLRNSWRCIWTKLLPLLHQANEEDLTSGSIYYDCLVEDGASLVGSVVNRIVGEVTNNTKVASTGNFGV